MKKFKVGDIVRANAKSDQYDITNIENEWEGTVISVNDRGCFKAITNSSKRCCQGEVWDGLYPDCFDLVKESKKGKVLVSNQATILFDEDGKKYVSKCSGEEFDLEKGIMMCLCKKHGHTYEDIKKLLKNTKYKDGKEVKRKAAVGEYIKIVSPFMAGDCYKKGDILEVGLEANREVFCKGMQVPIFESEYVVLEGYKPKRRFRM